VPEPEIAVGMPVDPTLRQQIVEQLGAIPAVVPDSVEVPCSRCSLLVWQGPRQMAAARAKPAIVVLCIFCLLRLHGRLPWNIQSLGNPDSRLGTE
jgi:hypothetical protein